MITLFFKTIVFLLLFRLIFQVIFFYFNIPIITQAKLQYLDDFQTRTRKEDREEKTQHEVPLGLVTCVCR